MNRLTGLLSWLLIAGCGGTASYPVSGKVTFDGKFVPVGEVVFTPDGAKGNHGPAFLADIKDGVYVSPAGRGHMGGAYTARIIGFDGKPSEAKGLVDARGTPLFAEYSVAFDLPAAPAVQDFTVPNKR
ncbi:MAG: hypothetical protein C0467_05390 [Planctomycetaceae bacterium]|nr:hypothetical protein [Planctomycetaceae bacterium]